MKQKQHGFTILELLLVIVVIAILAIVVIIAYTNIQRSAKISLISSDLQTGQRQLTLDQVERGAFVENLNDLNGGTGIQFSDGIDLYYSVYNDSDPPNFCLTATMGDLVYKITADEGVTEGACSDQSPTAPSLAATADSTSQITVSWEAVENATSYRVEYSTADDFTGDASSACNAPYCVSGITGTSYSFTGLEQNTDYYFRAFTINSLGHSDASDVISETTLAATPDGAPTLTAGTSACTTIDASWTAIDPVTSYTLQYSTSSTFAGTPGQVTGLTGLSTTITGLTCGTKYYLRVAAVNGAQGPWSNVANKTTTISTPGTPSVSVTIPGSTRAGSSSNWAQSYDSKPGGSGTWYYAQASVSGSSCPSGTTRQFRTRIQYNSPTTWGAWTGWSTATTWYGVQPNSGYGIRFGVQARCYTSATTSSTSSTGYGCRWRSGSTSCSGF